jgi:hypothetical protein
VRCGRPAKGCVEYLERLAEVAVAQHRPEQAARWWGVAEVQREVLGLPYHRRSALTLSAPPVSAVISKQV